MLRTIMVPLDESTLAEQALPLAISIAQQTGARLLLVEVVPLPIEPLALEDTFLSVDEQVASLSAYARQYLRGLRKRVVDGLAQAGTPLEVGTHSLVGEPGAALADYAEESDVDLIVMATHGRSGFSRWALGSVADKVSQLSQIPVIVMRPDHNEALDLSQLPAPKRILVALDGSPLAEQAFPLTTELSKAFNAEMLIFRTATLPVGFYSAPETLALQPALWQAVEEETKNYLEGVAGRLSQEGLNVRSAIGQGNVVESILNATDQHSVDLIAMTTHGRTGLSRLVFGSVTDRVLRSGHRPVLIMRPPLE